MRPGSSRQQSRQPPRPSPTGHHFPLLSSPVCRHWSRSEEGAAMHAIFRTVKVIPVVTIERAADAVPLARALAKGGLDCIEVTLRTPEAPAAIAAIARDVPEVVVGAGTVLRAADVSRAREAGAKFLVSPGLTEELASAGLATGLPYIPGAITPSEMMAARELGFSLLKFFPAEASGGIAALRQ